MDNWEQGVKKFKGQLDGVSDIDYLAWEIGDWADKWVKSNYDRCQYWWAIGNEAERCGHSKFAISCYREIVEFGGPRSENWAGQTFDPSRAQARLAALTEEPG